MRVLFLQGRQLSETLECFTWRPDKLTFLERPIYIKKKIVVIRYILYLYKLYFVHRQSPSLRNGFQFILYTLFF